MAVYVVVVSTSSLSMYSCVLSVDSIHVGVAGTDLVLDTDDCLYESLVFSGLGGCSV